MQNPEKLAKYKIGDIISYDGLPIFKIVGGGVIVLYKTVVVKRKS